MPKIPTLAAAMNPIDNVMDIATSVLYGGGANNGMGLATGMLNMGPVNEQSMRKSMDPKAGIGQDDSMPNIPSVSIGVAQHDMELEKQRMIENSFNETRGMMFVSQDPNQ